MKITTYEEDRLNYFEKLMRESQYRYNRLFKRFKNAPIMSAEAQRLSDAGREVHFHGDVVEMLEKGYRKQKEGEWIWDREHSNYKCSLCGEYDTITPNFCRGCGAKMKGGAE